MIFPITDQTWISASKIRRTRGRQFLEGLGPSKLPNPERVIPEDKDMQDIPSPNLLQAQGFEKGYGLRRAVTCGLKNRR